MIKLLAAYTREADDPAKAVGEIQEQLNFEKERLANSMALLFCHNDFLVSGVAAAVSESLPCEVLGCTSLYFALLPSGNPPDTAPDAALNAADEIMLTVAVLSSDDTEFAAGLSGPLTIEDAETRIHAVYRETAAALGEPSMIFALLPLMLDLSGDIVLSLLDHACGGIPVFGTCAMDVDQQTRDPKIIFRGKAYNNRVALLFLKGPVKPRFFSSTFPEQFVFAQDAVITGVDGQRIISINNAPAVSFLEETGLMQEGKFRDSATIPLLVDYHDETAPEVFIIRDISPEGALICSRKMRPGGILNIGATTADYVLESAKSLIRKIKETGNDRGGFMFSCFMRNIALGGNTMEEIKLIQKELAGFPGTCLFCYSGGEICPQYTKSGGTKNQFYQYALIACQL
jgi:hypothetical protein